MLIYFIRKSNPDCVLTCHFRGEFYFSYVFATDRAKKNVYITRIRLAGRSGNQGFRVFIFTISRRVLWLTRSLYPIRTGDAYPPPPNRGAKVKACSNFFLPLPPNIHGVVLNQALGQFYIFIGLRNVETQKYLLCIYRCLLLLLSTSFDLLF